MGRVSFRSNIRGDKEKGTWKALFKRGPEGGKAALFASQLKSSPSKKGALKDFTVQHPFWWSSQAFTQLERSLIGFFNPGIIFYNMGEYYNNKTALNIKIRTVFVAIKS